MVYLQETETAAIIKPVRAVVAPLTVHTGKQPSRGAQKIIHMKTKVKLGLNKMSVSELLGYSAQVVSKMTNNPFFASPTPALDKITGATTALQDSFIKAQGGGRSQTSVMHQNRVTLEDNLTTLGYYVEAVANHPDNAETGANAIVFSAGMDVKQFTPAQRQVFSVKNGNMPGTIVLTAGSVKRGSHEWQYAANPPADGWTDAEPTVQATTIIMGLEPGKRYTFRHRSVLTDGPAAWEDPQSLIVV